MYQLKLEQFEGPFSLLLQLIEAKNLDITKLTLSDITSDYLEHVEALEQMDFSEIAEFLVIAARLLLIKSLAILPILEQELSEDEVGLEEKLRRYKIFSDLAQILKGRINEEKFLFSREAFVGISSEFLPPKNLITDNLFNAIGRVINEYKKEIVVLDEVKLRKRVSLEEKIGEIFKILEKKMELSLKDFQQKDKSELVLIFLALLHLCEHNKICLYQDKHFEEITIKLKG